MATSSAPAACRRRWFDASRTSWPQQYGHQSPRYSMATRAPSRDRRSSKSRMTGSFRRAHRTSETGGGPEQWRDAMDEALRADDGWLTPAGLSWLPEGSSAFGVDGDAAPRRSRSVVSGSPRPGPARCARSAGPDLVAVDGTPRPPVLSDRRYTPVVVPRVAVARPYTPWPALVHDVDTWRALPTVASIPLVGPTSWTHRGGRGCGAAPPRPAFQKERDALTRLRLRVMASSWGMRPQPQEADTSSRSDPITPARSVMRLR